MNNRDLDLIREKSMEYGGIYGLEHSLRLIGLVRCIARGRSYNEDVVAFSAYVHDFGAYPQFMETGKDHAIRTLELLPDFLKMYDFSPEEEALIRETIACHHAKEKPGSFEATLFRDADAVDFLGYIGIARDLLRSGKDLQKALEFIRKHRAALPGILYEEEALRMAQERIVEMDIFLSRLDPEHFTLLS